MRRFDQTPVKCTMVGSVRVPRDTDCRDEGKKSKYEMIRVCCNLSRMRWSWAAQSKQRVIENTFDALEHSRGGVWQKSKYQVVIVHSVAVVGLCWTQSAARSSRRDQCQTVHYRTSALTFDDV